MHLRLGWTLLTASAVLLVLAAVPLRTRLHPRVVDALLGLSGAGIALGGLCFVEDVGAWSWVFAAVVLGIGAIVHVRALFEGAGPFRT